MSSFATRWSGFWSRHDPDDVFSYNSLKMVTIRDRYLGLLHHCLQIGILIYIIVYVIFVSKQFLELNDAVGLVRIGVKDRGDGNVDPNLAGVCSIAPATGLPPCIFPLVDQISEGSGPNMFITTHMNATAYTSPCLNTDPTCKPIAASSQEFYIGNLDDIIISIDHSAQVDFGGIAPKGTMETMKNPDADIASWTKCKDCSINEFQSLAADEFPLSTLFTAAKLDLSAEATTYLKGTPGYSYATFRSFGAVILLSVTYNNVNNYFRGDPPILYSYRPQLIDSIDDYQLESIYTSYPDNRTVLYKKGIRIIGLLTGQIGNFRFQTLLIQLTTSLALMKVATTVVDLIAINLLPARALYRGAKFERTEDFSEIRSRSTDGKNGGINSDPTSVDPPVDRA